MLFSIALGGAGRYVINTGNHHVDRDMPPLFGTLLNISFGGCGQRSTLDTMKIG